MLRVNSESCRSTPQQTCEPFPLTLYLRALWPDLQRPPYGSGKPFPVPKRLRFQLVLSELQAVGGAAGRGPTWHTPTSCRSPESRYCM